MGMLPMETIQAGHNDSLALFRQQGKIFVCLFSTSVCLHGWIQRGDRMSGPPMKNHKTKGFLSNTGLDPL